MNRRQIAPIVVCAAATVAALWLYVSHGRRPHRAEPVPIQDGRTIDFSNGSPVLKEDPANRAKMDAALRQMEEAAKTVTFPAEPTPTPAK